jgi:hypothetical protein
VPFLMLVLRRRLAEHRNGDTRTAPAGQTAELAQEYQGFTGLT